MRETDRQPGVYDDKAADVARLEASTRSALRSFVGNCSKRRGGESDGVPRGTIRRERWRLMANWRHRGQAARTARFGMRRVDRYHWHLEDGRSSFKSPFEPLHVLGHLIRGLPTDDQRDKQLSDPVPRKVQFDRHS